MNSTDNSPKNTLIAAVLAALGIPGAFAAWILSHNPIVVMVISVTYFAIVGFIGFTNDVMKIVKPKMTKATADWLDRQAASIPWRFFFKKKYLVHVAMSQREFDVKGLKTQGPFALELDQVFVNLGVDAKSLEQVSSRLASRKERTSSPASRSAWDYIFEFPSVRSNFAILGAPGSGKTTLLRHIALAIATKQSFDVNGVRVQIKKIPFFLSIREIAEKVTASPDYDLAQAIQDRETRYGFNVSGDWILRHLNKGDCIMLLDGLDEVANPENRQKVVSWVKARIDRYQRVQFVVSSRPFGYRANPIDHVSILEVQPFTYDQVKDFVQKWYLATEWRRSGKNDAGTKTTAALGSADFMSRLHDSSALLMLAVNPLLLTMMITVHKYNSSLPGRRVELYAQICEVFLGLRRQTFGVGSELTPSQKKRVLQPLAWHMMIKEVRVISVIHSAEVIAEPLAKVDPTLNAADFLKMIENESGLLIEREAGEYAFAHLTFQEYLASAHAIDQNKGDSLVLRVTSPWWHEVIRLFAAQGDATALVSKCLEESPPSIQELTLALQCIDEAREVQPDIRHIFRGVLDYALEDKDPQVRKLIAEVRLSLRLAKLQRIDETRFVDPDLMTNAEYELFLAERHGREQGCLPLIQKASRNEAGYRSKFVAGVRPSAAREFCSWLSARDPRWKYDLIGVDDEKKMPSDQMLVRPWQLCGTGYTCTPSPIADGYERSLRDSDLVQDDRDLRRALIRLAKHDRWGCPLALNSIPLRKLMDQGSSADIALLDWPLGSLLGVKDSMAEKHKPVNQGGSHPGISLKHFPKAIEAMSDIDGAPIFEAGYGGTPNMLRTLCMKLEDDLAGEVGELGEALMNSERRMLLRTKALLYRVLYYLLSEGADVGIKGLSHDRARFRKSGIRTLEWVNEAGSVMRNFISCRITNCIGGYWGSSLPGEWSGWN